MANIFDEYSFYKSVIQNKSKLTVEQYLTDLELFFKYIITKRKNEKFTYDEFSKIDLDIVDLELCKSVTQEEVYGFFSYVSTERKNSARTRARKLSSLKSFYNYLTVKKNYFENNPVKNIESPSVKPSLPKFLTEQECLVLLSTIENDKKSKNNIRDYCIITLFLNCGMRLSELVGINLSDIDPELKSLRVIGKGNKERIVYLNQSCKSSMYRWLNHRSTMEIIDKKALFISDRGNRISNKTIQAIVYKYLKMAGFENKKLSVHKLRHTAATLMYQSGNVDVRVLKEILGHEQLNTTQIYTHVTNKNIENAMSQNPLANINHTITEDNSENE